MDKVEMASEGGGTPPSPHYTLFPRHWRSGPGTRSRRHQEKLNVEFGSWRKTDPQLKIMSRQNQVREVSVEDPGWPSIGKTGKEEFRPSEKPSSFADMVRRKPQTEPAKQVPVRGREETAVSVRNNKKAKSKTKPVLNKISAFTYSQIGRSDDESKYVSSSRPLEDSRTRTIPSAVRRDVVVEFKESDDDDDDFHVEFSSSAVVKKADRNTVNKISAVTFQQIGKTSSDQAKYVMQPPKSWSSIVGNKNTQNLPAKPEAADEKGSEREKSREPSVHDKIKAKMKEGIELSTEEREILRQKRRDRRKREKEIKKKEKEDKQIQDIYKPQTTKLNMISGELLSKCKDMSSSDKKARNQNENKIKFLDEEYPDLTGRKKRAPQVISTEIRDEEGRLQSSERESNSEWETEDEHKELAPDLQKSEDEVKIEIVSNEKENFSYSSILKSSKPPPPKIVETPEPTKETVPATSDNKKVKKHDPILFDLTSALQVTKQKTKKVAGVTTGKLKKEVSSKAVRNQLDSTAPMRKRGKEREGGKKKKKTLMKKIIIADRERRREERLKTGITLKPLSPPDEDIFSESTKVLERSETENGAEVEDVEKSDEANVSCKDNAEQGEKKHEVADEMEISKKCDEKSSDDAVAVQHSMKKSNEKDKLQNSEDVEEFKRSIEIRDKNRRSLDKQTEAEVVEKFLESSVEEKALMNLHSRKFRSYCDHLLSAELDNSVAALMSDLIRFQDKVHAKDPEKARAKRRFVVGLRECAKFLKVKKISCMIFAPNIEKIEAEGGLDDAISQLIRDAGSVNVPVVFGLNRYKLGRLCFKKVPISCIGILNYQGSDANYKRMLEQASELRDQYQVRLQAEIDKLRSPVRASSTPSSLLSCEAAEFVPSSQFYSYYQQESYYPNLYPGYQQQYLCYDEPDEPPTEAAKLVPESQIWNNMMDILKSE